MQTPWTNSVKTLEQARDFVLEVGMCGVLHDSKGTLPTLWDAGFTLMAVAALIATTGATNGTLFGAANLTARRSIPLLFCPS